MAYTHTTLSQAKSQLARLLHDTGNVHWVDAELGVYLDEALRTWGVGAAYWRERGVFNTVAGTAFYDLSTELSALRGYSVTDTNLVRDIQYHLLEPATGSSWTGTEQFTLQQVTDALQRRRDQWLVETGLVMDHFLQNVAGVPDGRVTYSDNVIDVRRLAWLESDGVYTPLWRDDEVGALGFNLGWMQEPGTPHAYSVVVVPPLTVQLINTPLSTGRLDTVAVRSGAALNPAGGVVMGVPDDFTPYVKWGALADLLGKDGQAYDPQRAAYCEQRWSEGLELAKVATVVLQTMVNGVVKPMSALYELDAFDPNWQNTSDRPETVAMAGLHLMVLSDVPDAVYGMAVDVVRNAPIPADDDDYLEVGREELEAIVAYAQHLASFKMGGEEFEATKQHYERFFKLAALRNGRLRAAARNFTVLHDRSRVEEGGRPRVEEVTV